MILRTGNWQIRISVDKRRRQAARLAGFTLIELILVMALLLIVLSVSGPTLSRFFKGRELDNEGRRIVSLTRYGQSRAVAEGVPVVFWIDVAERGYGLRLDEAFVPKDPKELEFELSNELKFEVPDRNAVSRGLAKMRFLPDGSISETSLDLLGIENEQKELLWIGQSLNRLHYEIQSPTNLWQVRR